MPGRTARSERAGTTKENLLATAERLFAEHGVHAVSNRQISDAAGQGNNTAVGYHFGTRTDLVRAIARRHTEDVERLRTELVEQAAGSTRVRDWVSCLIRPTTTHLHRLGTPTWFARFGAQAMTDPVLREIMIEESLNSPSLLRAIDGLNACLPHLPPEIRAERNDMARQLMVHTTAERERALADDSPTARATWHDAGTGLIDAITGLWLAPVST